MRKCTRHDRYIIISCTGPPRQPGLLPGGQQRLPQLTPQQILALIQQQQAIHQARMAAAAALKLQQQQQQQQQHGSQQQPYLQHHPIQQSQQSAVATAALLAHHQQQQQLVQAQAAQAQAQAQAQALAQHQQRFDKNSPPNTVTVTQPSFIEAAAALQYQQQGLLSRHPGAGGGGKVGGSAPFGNEVAAIQHQIHTFQQQQQQQQYGKSQAALVHSQQQQQRGGPQTQIMMPHPPPPVAPSAAGGGGGGVEPNQNQQMMERQQREANSVESNKSGLSISAMPFVPTSNTPPTARKFNSSAPNVAEGIPPPPHSVSAIPVGVGGNHVTRPNAPLLQHVVLPPGHMVPTPPPPPPSGGMLPIPRPRPQQMHVGNPAQFQHPQVSRKTSASSQGQSLLGGPAYQVIDKAHHPAGTVNRQLSGGEGSGGASKPPPGLSLPIRPSVMGDQGSTSTPHGVLMDLQQARTMAALNRSGHALVSTTPLTTGAAVGYAGVRPQHPHHQIHELPSLYGAPPTKMQPSVTTGGNKRALLPTPTATAPIHAAAQQLGFLAAGGGAHHIAAVAPSASLPPGVQSWSGGNMRVPHSHRVIPPPPPSVTNHNSHRQQQVIYTQEQVVQRSNYGSGGYSGRGAGGNGVGM